MTALFWRVARAEGLASASRQAYGWIQERTHRNALLIRGRFLREHACVPVINVLSTPPARRLGGIQVQLVSRLRIERTLRPVALMYPYARSVILQFSSPREHAIKIRGAFRPAVHRALEITRGEAIHIEGTHDIPTREVIDLMDDGVKVIISVHDFSLLAIGQRDVARELLQRARRVIFPSSFLLREHQRLFSIADLEATIIEPGISAHRGARRPTAPGVRIAYAGRVSRHKGAHLLPSVIEAFERQGIEWHIFGGGDPEILRPLRRCENTIVHGYYTAPLPDLLSQFGIDLVLMPSMVAESFGLTLSECWAAGVPVIAFAHGALKERIERWGGGWLVPLEEESDGMIRSVHDWLAGMLRSEIPRAIPSDHGAATAHIAMYQWISS